MFLRGGEKGIDMIHASLLLLFCLIPFSKIFAKSYPTYENGASLPLAQRPLQALDTGSTFQLPRETGNLAFWGGVVQSKTAECFIHAEAEHGAPVEALHDTCVLNKIEGAEYLKLDEPAQGFSSRMELFCRGSSVVKIVCKKLGAKTGEMTIGEFESVFAKKLYLGKVILETPLANTTPSGYPIENPVTPEQIISSKLTFEIKDQTVLSQALAGGEIGNGFTLTLQNGTAPENPVVERGGLALRVKPVGGTLKQAPKAADVNGMKITSAEAGYYKDAVEGGEALRRSYLLVRGEKVLQGVRTEISASWSDPSHSHITYEGMWKIPGRSTIENGYNLDVN